MAISDGRTGEIRTPDLLHPMQARYQATLQPEFSEFLHNFQGQAIYGARDISLPLLSSKSRGVHGLAIA